MPTILPEWLHASPGPAILLALVMALGVAMWAYQSADESARLAEIDRKAAAIDERSRAVKECDRAGDRACVTRLLEDGLRR